MIQIDGLQVRFGALTAVDGLTLTVPEGCLFGLLGPNGAGKTTTLSCVAGLRRPDAGTVRVDGVDAAQAPLEVQRRLGVVPQALALYGKLSVVQNLRVFGGLLGLSAERLRDRVEWALALAQLESRTEALVETLSGGMKRRLNLACSLLHDPPVILCDEPTAGVDPQSRNHLFETIKTLHADGRTIVYTTHYMEEVQALCSQVAIMDHGRLVTCDALDALLAPPSSSQTFELSFETDREVEALRAALAAGGLDDAQITPAARSLEQVFLDLTGHALRDDP